MERIVQIENITKNELLELLSKGNVVKEIEKTSPDEELLTSRQLATYLNVSTQTLVRWRQQGKIPYYGSGKSIFHKKSEVLDALRAEMNLK